MVTFLEINAYDVHGRWNSYISNMSEAPFDMLEKRRTFCMICDGEYPQGLRSNVSRNSTASVTAIKGVVVSDVDLFQAESIIAK